MLRRTGLILAILIFVSGGFFRVSAQQFVVDDAEVIDHLAFQLEGWYGEHASWVLPAFSPLAGLELTAGLGFIKENDGRSLEYVVQAKYIFRPLETGSYGIGVVAGAGAAPVHQSWRSEVHDVFAYVPASLSLFGDGLIVHGNIGWLYETDGHEYNGVVHDESHHVFTWGIRSDVAVAERFTIVAELFGEDRFPPEWQVGLRTIVVPERLEIDVSYGRHFDTVLSGVGFNVGLAWTPPALR